VNYTITLFFSANPLAFCKALGEKNYKWSLPLATILTKILKNLHLPFRAGIRNLSLTVYPFSFSSYKLAPLKV